MNAKDRRKAKREAERQQQSDLTIPEEHEEEKPTTQVKDIDTLKMTAKERRKAKRAAAREQQTEEEIPQKEKTEGQEPSLDTRNMTAKERRKAKRAALRTEESKDERLPQENMKKRKLPETSATKPLKKKKPVKARKIHLTVFVGQIPFTTTKEQLIQHFQQGSSTEMNLQVRMLTDKKTNKFKGTAFVEVDNDSALGAVLSRHHTLLNGRRINVEMTASGGGTKSTLRKERLTKLRDKQQSVQVEKANALIQKYIDDKEKNFTEADRDDILVRAISWFDIATAKKAMDEFCRCVNERVKNRPAFMMGILRRFRPTDGVE